MPATTPGQGIGGGVRYDYGVPVPEFEGHRLFSTSGVAGISLEGHLVIPVGPVELQPGGFFFFAQRDVVVENRNGEYIPNGYVWRIPQSSPVPDYIETEPYQDLSSDVWLTERGLGGYAVIPFGKSFGLGSGAFNVKRTADVRSDVYVDGYYFLESENGEDVYGLDETYFEGRTKNTFSDSVWKYPLLVRFRQGWRGLTSGYSLVYWLGAERSAVSFRYTIGLQL